jgi:LssY C-terminus
VEAARSHLGTLIVAGAALVEGQPMLLLLIAVAALVALALIIGVWRVVRLTRRLEAEQTEADEEGEESSARGPTERPLMTFSRFGTAGDPLNVKVVATAEQVVTAFSSAGWYRADRIRVLSSLRLSIATVFRLRYSSAPMSNQYLFGRKQDYAFQKPGSDVRERDHVRFWETGERARDGRSVWVGAATRDVDVAISPRTRLITHRIAPDVDSERATVAHDLTATGGVITAQWEHGFGGPVELVNAMGYPFHSDGRVAVLTLADVPVLLPVAVGLPGHLGDRLRGDVARLFRWRLPHAGRLRAREQGMRDTIAAHMPRRGGPPAEAS